jgi:hypothetical protein
MWYDLFIPYILNEFIYYRLELFASLFNPENAELNSICQLLALLGTHPILHVSRMGLINSAGSC